MDAGRGAAGTMDAGCGGDDEAAVPWGSGMISGVDESGEI